MSLQKSEAIILKTQRLGETSKILTLYSRKFGKMKVVAKGSRGLKSRFFGTLEPLNHIAIVYYFKETRELQLLSQADIIHAFVNLKDNLEKYSLAAFFCDLIDRTQLEQSNIYLFQVLVDSLTEMDKATAQPLNIFFWFILKFLHLNGFKPHFESCKICHRSEIKTEVRFSLIDGCYLCENCNGSGPLSLTVSKETIKYFLRLQRAPAKEISSIEKADAENCEALLMSFLQYHIEEAKYLKSLKFLRNLQSNS